MVADPLGRKLGPRLHSTGTIVYGADGTARCEINSLLDATDRLRQYAGVEETRPSVCRARVDVGRCHRHAWRMATRGGGGG